MVPDRADGVPCVAQVKEEQSGEADCGGHGAKQGTPAA
jgi:hypothetical protein